MPEEETVVVDGAGEGETVVDPATDDSYGDPPYPEGHGEAPEPVTQGGEGEAGDAGAEGAGVETPAAEKPPGTEDGKGEKGGGIPEDWDSDEYMVGAFGGEPSAETVAKSHKKLQDDVGASSDQNRRLQQDVIDLKNEVLDLKAGGGAEKVEALSLEGIEDAASKRTAEQLGERPDENEDPAEARKWDSRNSLNLQDVRDENKQSVDSRRVESTRKIGGFMDANFPDPAIRHAFEIDLDPILSRAGISADQLTPELLEYVAKGWGSGLAIRNAYLGGQQSILNPTLKAAKAGAPIHSLDGGGGAPAGAGGDTEDQLRADVRAGKIDTAQYRTRLKALKAAGLAK